VSHEWLRKGDVTAGKSTPRDHQSGDIVFVESSDRLQDGSPGPESESEAATASQPEDMDLSLSVSSEEVQSSSSSAESEEDWSTDEEDLSLPAQTSIPDSSSPVWQFVFILLLWQSLYKISNAAISGLLRFLKAFVYFFGGAYAGLNVLDAVPSSAEGALRYLGMSKDSSFVTYVVCPKCNSIYNYDDCVLSRGTTKESKHCKHIAYPNHPQASRRKECGGLLLKKVKSGKSYKLIPLILISHCSFHLADLSKKKDLFRLVNNGGSEWHTFLRVTMGMFLMEKYGMSLEHVRHLPQVFFLLHIATC
jgi:hypothetical protein